MQNFSIYQKLLVEILDYVRIFPCGGHIPLDTHEWHDVLFPYPAGPNGMVERDRAVRESGYESIVELATNSFPRFNFNLKLSDFEDETCKVSTPYTYWLQYTIKPEEQE